MAPTETADAVEAELAQVCGLLNQSHARLVALVAAALDDDVWAGGGFRSVEHWLAVRAGLSPGRAAALVRIARRVPDLPATSAAFTAGRLSVDQVSAFADQVPERFESSVAELAEHASVTQLRRVVSRYAFDAGPAASSERPAPADTTDTAHTTEAADTTDTAHTAELAAASPELRMWTSESGRFELRFSAAADIGALVEAALDEAKDALFLSRRPSATLADALLEVCARSRGTVSSRGRRDAFRVWVHLDTNGGWLNGRPALPHHLTAKLTCDGVLQPVWERDGTPVSVGRSQRIVPSRLRRLVEDRDRGCRFPGCGAVAHVEGHHLVHWRDGGATDLDNIVSLCPHHHDGQHAGEFTISGDPGRLDALAFRTRSGRVIGPGPVYRPPPEGAPSPSPDGRAYPGSSGEPLHLRWVSFAPTSATQSLSLPPPPRATTAV